MHRYEQIAQIGKGSFGVVYRCRLKQTGQFVAVKQISTYGKSSSELSALGSEIALLREIDHPNAIRFFESFEEDGNIVIVTELAQSDLYDIFVGDGPLQMPTLQKISFQLLSVLSYLHKLRIAHRDIKAQNVLISQGMCKLCDFGFARQMSQQTIALQSIKGTPLYMAPEIAKGKKYNTQSDMWAFGVMIFELATGKTPFIANDFLSLMALLKDDSNKVPYDKYPIFAEEPLFKNFVECMLQRNPDKRWTSVQMLDHPYLNSGASIRLAKHVNSAYTYKNWYALLKIIRQQMTQQSLLGVVNVEAVVEGVAPPEQSERYAEVFYDQELIDVINSSLEQMDIPPLILAFLEVVSINANQVEAIFTSEYVSAEVHDAASHGLEQDYYRILEYVHRHPSEKDEAFYWVVDFLSYLVVRSANHFLTLFGLVMKCMSKQQFSVYDATLMALLVRVSAICCGCDFSWNVPMAMGAVVSFPYDLYFTADRAKCPSTAEEKPVFTRRAHILATAIMTLCTNNATNRLFESFNVIVSKSIAHIEVTTDPYIIRVLLYVVQMSVLMSIAIQSCHQFLMQEYVLYAPSMNRMVGLEHLLYDETHDGDEGEDEGSDGLKQDAANGPRLKTIDIRYDIGINDTIFGQMDTREYNKFRFLPPYFKGFIHSGQDLIKSDTFYDELEFNYLGINLSQGLIINVRGLIDSIFQRCTKDYPILLTKLYAIYKKLSLFNNGIKLDEGYVTVYDSYIQFCTQLLFTPEDSADSSTADATTMSVIRNVNLPLLGQIPGDSPKLKYMLPSLGSVSGSAITDAMANERGGRPAATPRDQSLGTNSMKNLENNLGMSMQNRTLARPGASLAQSLAQSMTPQTPSYSTVIEPSVDLLLLLLQLRRAILNFHDALTDMLMVRLPSYILTTGRLRTLYAYCREPYCYNMELSGSARQRMSRDAYQSTPAADLNMMLATNSKSEIAIIINSENNALADYLTVFKKQLAMCYCFLPFAYIQKDEESLMSLISSAEENFTQLMGNKDSLEAVIKKRLYHGSVLTVEPRQRPPESYADLFKEFSTSLSNEIAGLRADAFRFLREVFAPSFQYIFPFFTYILKDLSPLAQYAAFLRRQFKSPGLPNGDEITLSDITDPNVQNLCAVLIQASLPQRGHFIFLIPQLCYIFDGLFTPVIPFSNSIIQDPFSTFSLYRTNVNLVSNYMISADSIRMVVINAFFDGLIVSINNPGEDSFQVLSIAIQKYIDIHCMFAKAKAVPAGDYLYQGIPACAYTKSGTEDEKIVIDKNAQIAYLDREHLRINALSTLFNCSFCNEEFARILVQMTFSISDLIIGKSDSGRISLITLLFVSCLWLQAHTEEDDLRLTLLSILLRLDLELCLTMLENDSQFLLKLYKPDQLTPDFLLLCFVTRVSMFSGSVVESLEEAKIVMNGSSFKRVDDPVLSDESNQLLNQNPHDFNILSNGALLTERIMKECIRTGGTIDYGMNNDGIFDKYSYPPLVFANSRVNIRRLRRSYYYLSTGTAVEVPSINNYLELEVPVPVLFASIDAVCPILEKCERSLELIELESEEHPVTTCINENTMNTVVSKCITITRALFSSMDYVLVEPSFRASLIPCQNFFGFIDSTLKYLYILSKRHVEVLPLLVKVSIYLNLSLHNSVEAAFCAVFTSPHHGRVIKEDPTMIKATENEDLKQKGEDKMVKAKSARAPLESSIPLGNAATRRLVKTSRELKPMLSDIHYEKKEETGVPQIDEYLIQEQPHLNCILMCCMINGCNECLADTLGLDTKRYDLSGIEGRNTDIWNANWHWAYLSSPLGLKDYILAIRRALYLIGNHRLLGLTDIPPHVNYNTSAWTSVTSTDEFNQILAFPLPEVIRLLCAMISTQSLDNVLTCAVQFGGGRSAVIYLIEQVFLAIYHIIRLSCCSIPFTDELTGQMYDPKLLHITEYISAILLEFNFIKHALETLQYLPNVMAFETALTIILFFSLHPEGCIALPWLLQFVFAGGASMNLVSAVFTSKNMAHRSEPTSCILKFMYIYSRVVQVSSDFAELISNSLNSELVLQMLSLESSEHLVGQTCKFIGYLVKRRPQCYDAYNGSLDYLTEIMKTRRRAMMAPAIFTMTQLAKVSPDPTFRIKVIQSLTKTLMNARLLDDIKTTATVAGTHIMLAHEDTIQEFVEGEGVVSIVDCIVSCDDVEQKLIYVRCLTELQKSPDIIRALKGQLHLLRPLIRESKDPRLKEQLEELSVAVKR
ncbi:Kinase, ULK [Giardia muris]|uniref:non-specific serine/threonine protein kinase n=1 Tax=Giardia muris TaxID=5742 RepID=A0A4Z1TBD1_GIAMU|nr:Kinase, ULK [Giardia muris]|eukprot:TNJ30557.1 Kinase, ULK [Giardia muris]